MILYRFLGKWYDMIVYQKKNDMFNVWERTDSTWCPSRTELLITYVIYLESPRGGGGRSDAPPKIHMVAFARVRNKSSGRRHSTSMIKRTKYCFSKYQGSRPKHTPNQVAELRSAELLTSYYNNEPKLKFISRLLHNDTGSRTQGVK
jgi:hypothetical protein